MAFCANCGTQMGEGVKFCPSCGTRAATGGDAGGAAPVPAPKPATEKVGTIRKCPACGAEVPAMTAVCPSCGHEFSNVQVSAAVQSFFNKLETIGNIREKLSYINNFPVPNTKEDILEFAIMAESHIKPESGLGKIGYGLLVYASMGILYVLWKGPETWRFNKAWRTKIKQVYIKGKIALAGDKTALSQVEAIVAETEKVEKKSKRSFLVSLLCVIVFYAALSIGSIVLITAVGPSGEQNETSRLNTLYSEVIQNIKDGDLLDAKLKANQLIWEYYRESYRSETESWNQKRETILQEIETLQKQQK